MEENHDLKPLSSPSEEDYSIDEEEEVQKLLPTLEQETHWNGKSLVKYKGCWNYSMFLKHVLRMERYFKPRDTDIILSSMPRSGTTWLKALTYSITNRKVHSPTDQTSHPLITSNPHDLVPFLETVLYALQRNPNLEDMPSPRIFATHLSYEALPAIIHDSACKIIYICRNPLDQFVSEQHFLLENGWSNFFQDDTSSSRMDADRDAKTLFIDESIDKFVRGIVPFGPTWENSLGYWNAHLKNPSKVLFFKYEDLKKDDQYHIKKIAEFIGFPFSPQELENGLVEKISKLCSFENLCEANKEGTVNVIAAKKSSFFRKGEVGDWTNYLSKEMAQRMKDVMENKLEGSDLTLDFPGL